MTTLDELISAHGSPAFCKIDVEGYEAEVLAALSQPIAALSFEFTPEVRAVALECVDRLSRIWVFASSTCPWRVHGTCAPSMDRRHRYS
jgi:hypothetical protein